jgi:sugar/nucleoside kinase (ribokinase family)
MRVYVANRREAEEEGVLREDGQVVALPNFDVALIKDGARGVDVYELAGGRSYEVPTFPVQGVAVGSGDVFAGVIAAKLALGADMAQAARAGSAGAAIIISRRDNLAPPGLGAEIDAFLSVRA